MLQIVGQNKHTSLNWPTVSDNKPPVWLIRSLLHDTINRNGKFHLYSERKTIIEQYNKIDYA